MSPAIKSQYQVSESCMYIGITATCDQLSIGLTLRCQNRLSHPNVGLLSHYSIAKYTNDTVAWRSHSRDSDLGNKYFYVCSSPIPCDVMSLELCADN